MLPKSKGFTLIELMIATAILSGLLFLGGFTYQMLASRWQQELGEFQETLDITKSFNLLNGSIRAIQPYVVQNKKINNQDYEPGFLFVGRENRLLAVSKQGLFNHRYPEVFRLIVEENEDGSKNLIYQGVSTEGQLILTAQQTITFTQEITLLEKFDEIKFNYLGWDSPQVRSEGLENNALPTWRAEYSGLDNQLLPDEMALSLKKDGKDLLFTISFAEKSTRFLSQYINHDY